MNDWMPDNEKLIKQIKQIEQDEGLPAGYIAEVLYQQAKEGKNAGDIINKISGEFAKKIAEVKDAFILEELKPYFSYNSEHGIEWSQKVRFRLAEYKDFELRFKQEKENLRQRLLREIKNEFSETRFSTYQLMKYIINRQFGVEE